MLGKHVANMQVQITQIISFVE